MIDRVANGEFGTVYIDSSTPLVAATNNSPIRFLYSVGTVDLVINVLTNAPGITKPSAGTALNAVPIPRGGVIPVCATGVTITTGQAIGVFGPKI